MGPANGETPQRDFVVFWDLAEGGGMGAGPYRSFPSCAPWVRYFTRALGLHLGWDLAAKKIKGGSSPYLDGLTQIKAVCKKKESTWGRISPREDRTLQNCAPWGAIRKTVVVRFFGCGRRVEGPGICQSPAAQYIYICRYSRARGNSNGQRPGH